MIKCDWCEGWGLVYQPTGQAINLVKCRECFGIGKLLELERYEIETGHANLAPYQGRGGKSK